MDEQIDIVAAFYEKYSHYFFELRRHLIVIAVLFLIGCTCGFVYNQKIFVFILGLYNFKGVTIITTSPFQYIDLTLTTSFLTGCFLALPYGLLRCYYFFAPALTPKEQHIIKKLTPISVILFAVGFSFGMWITQLIINFYALSWTGGIVNSFWDIQHIFSQIIFTALLTGLIFQIPIVITFLIKLQIIKREILIKKRRFIYIILLIVAVLLPPTDLLSLIMLTLPLFFLFEFGLLLNRK